MTADDQRRQDLAISAAALAGEVATLNEQLLEQNRRMDHLSGDIRGLGQRSKTHSKWILGTIFTLVVDLAITVVIWLVFDQQSQIIARLEQSVLQQCDMYSLFLGSYRPESRPPGVERQTYEDNFARMRVSYHKLACTTPIVAPAAPAPAPPR